jgi:hypothetical protein
MNTDLNADGYNIYDLPSIAAKATIGGDYPLGINADTITFTGFTISPLLTGIGIVNTAEVVTPTISNGLDPIAIGGVDIGSSDIGGVNNITSAFCSTGTLTTDIIGTLNAPISVTEAINMNGYDLSGVNAFVATTVSTPAITDLLTINGLAYPPVPTPLPSGTYSVTVGSTIATITIPGLTTGGIVNLTYIHPGIGGGSQYFVTYTPSTDLLTVDLNQVGGVGDIIVWSVAQL